VRFNIAIFLIVVWIKSHPEGGKPACRQAGDRKGTKDFETGKKVFGRECIKLV